jgi:hypothetical protein
MLDHMFNEIENLINANDICEAEELIKYLQTFELNYEQGKLLHSYKSKLISIKLNNITKSSYNKSVTSTKDNYDKRITLLKDSVNTLLDTEIIASNIINNLSTQEEQIKKDIDKTQNINNNLVHSNKLTTKMSNWWRS